MQPASDHEAPWGRHPGVASPTRSAIVGRLVTERRSIRPETQSSPSVRSDGAGARPLLVPFGYPR